MEIKNVDTDPVWHLWTTFDRKQSYQTKARKDKSAQWKKFKLQFSCLYCGFPSEEIKKEGDYWVQALDFNHRDPSMKEGNLASLFVNSGEEKLRKEIAKCDVLCANCHRIYTAKQREAQQIDVTKAAWFHHSILKYLRF